MRVPRATGLLALALLAAAAAANAQPSSAFVSLNSLAYASCGTDGSQITGIVNPVFGNLTLGCNSTDSYRIVAASCVGFNDCLVRAATDIFGDPCPSVSGMQKTLSFSIVCSGTQPVLSPPPPSPFPSPPPPSPFPSPPPPRPSPPPPRPSPPPPRPSPPPPRPSPPPPASGNRQSSLLWGQNGELYRPGGRLGDWSQAGYGAAERAIPTYSTIVNVKDYGAKGDNRTDDSDAIQKAVDYAASLNSASGVTVFIPDGNYVLKGTVTIKDDKIVLKGSSPDTCKLYFPQPLESLYGKSRVWAFGGAFISVVGGKRMSSMDVVQKQADVTAAANRGDFRLKVSSTAKIAVGDWVRLWMPASDNTGRRRTRAASRRLQQAEQPAPPGKVTVEQAPVQIPPVPQWFDDPKLQAALEAAVRADWELGLALEANPDRVPSQALDPNATNPLGLDPMLLAAAYYASMAQQSEPDPGKAPAAALQGSLESYLYGNNLVDSGDPKSTFYGKDRVRFVSRVAAKGADWVQFERPLPYDVELKWKPVLHKFAPRLQESGIENLQLIFPWSPYPDHLEVKGFNGMAIYDAANCWIRNVKFVNADNGVMVGGSDFVTVTGVETQFTKKRGTGPMDTKNVNGHHALWVQGSSTTLVTQFDIPWRWFHDLSVDSFAESNVYADGQGQDINIDCHRAGTHDNLFTNIDMGVGTRPFNSGGAKMRGAQSGANNTWWNIYGQPEGSNALGLPDCDFGPLLNFFGMWDAPGSKGSGSEGGARKLLAGSTAAAAPGDGSALPVAAQSSAWCSQLGWWVEDLASGRKAFPADLYAAMVAARKSGNMT